MIAGVIYVERHPTMQLRSLSLFLAGLLVYSAWQASAGPAATAHHAPQRVGVAEPAATDVPVPRRSITIRGRVTRGVEGDERPLANIPVILWASHGRCDWSVRTDRNGRFERRCADMTGDGVVQVHVLWGSSVEPWTHEYLVAELVGTIGSGDVVVRIPPATPEPASTPDGPTPTPASADDLHYVSLTGNVVDGSHLGEPAVVGANVTVYPNPLFECLSPVVTDQRGFFEVWCPKASYQGTMGQR